MFLRFVSLSQESSGRRISSSKPSYQKTQEDDDATKTTEALEQRNFHGVDFSYTNPKVYYENRAHGSPNPRYMQTLKHKKKDSIGVLINERDLAHDKRIVKKWWNDPKH